MFNVNEIRELVRMIDRSTIGELTIRTDKNCEIIIKKGTGATPAIHSIVPEQPPVKSQQNVESVVPIRKSEQIDTKPHDSKQPPLETNQDLYHIVSPMVGIFYCAPSPDEDPFVQVGDEVSEDKVVCIVEAMKLFNEIEAEVSGEVVEVLVNDGELVEYGQPLLAVKKK